MKNLFTIILLTLFISFFGNAQNVAINTDGTNANSDAILHLKSTSKGLLIPSMTSSQRTSISNVSDGLMVYDTQTNSFWFRDSGTWTEIVSGDIETDIIKDADNNTKIQMEEGSNDNKIRFDIDGTEYLVLSKNSNGFLMAEMPNNSNNTFIGDNAGLDSSGGGNTFVGEDAGRDNVAGVHNNHFGQAAGRDQTTGNFNTYLGSGAGAFKTGGGNNTLLGYQAGISSASGSNNVMIGYTTGSNETGSNKLYIDNSTTSKPLIYGDFSSNKLQVNGDFYVNENSATNATAQLYFKVNDINKFSMAYETANDFFVIKDEVNNDRVLYIKDGKVGVQRSSPSNDFEVNGTASKTTAGDWLANSDARLKKNITFLSSNDILQKMLSLKGVTYEWDDDKTGYKRPEGTQYGFTAQNIQEVFPELVTEDNLGYLQTAYGTYDAMYVESIRALLQKINDLESDLDQLKGLEARLNKLEAAIGLTTSK